MKTKLGIAFLVTLLLSACNPKTAAAKNELRLIEETVRDTAQPEFVRESAGVFANILSEKQGTPRSELMRSHWHMVAARNATNIATYVAFLQATEDKAGSAKIIAYNAAQTVIILSNSIQNITLYNDPAADTEVEGVLKRLTEKHGASETREKILTFLNMVREQFFQARASGIKPWESPRRRERAID